MTNGYFQIDNETAEGFARLKLTPTEWRVLWVILRKTNGWQKPEDWIPLTQFQDATGIAVKHVCRAINGLVRKGVVAKDIIGGQTVYGIQKDPAKWQGYSLNRELPEQGTPQIGNSPNRESPTPKIGNQVLPKQGVSKDITSKDTSSKNMNCPKPPYVEIITHLNEKAGTHYRASSAATKEKIDARWNEGWRLPDFIKVIDVKAAEWRGTEHGKYLRPETLFGPKFESYLNQDPKEAKRSERKGYRVPNLPDWKEVLRKREEDGML